MDINAGVEAVISDPKVLEPRAEDGRATSQKSQRKVNNYLVLSHCYSTVLVTGQFKSS